MARGDSFLGDQAAAEVFDDKAALTAVLAAVQEAQDGASADVSTEEARKALVSLAAKVTRTKTALDEAGKAKTEEARKLVDTVNARRKVIRERLERAAEAIRAPVTRFETAEQERQVAHQKMVAMVLAARTVVVGTPADEVQRRIDELRDLATPNDLTDEELEKLTDERITSLSLLETMLPSMRQAEANAARLAEMEAEARQREREQAAQRQQHDAMEKELALAREQAAAAEKRAADQVAEAIEREAEERAARETNIENRNAVRARIIEALGQEARINTQIAERVATALMAGVIPHIKVEF